MSTSEKPPTLDPVAAQRWASRPLPASAWLHEEVARRMQERLDVIRLQPQAWADWEPLRGGLQAHQALRSRYPQAALWQVLDQPDEARRVQTQTASAWWQPSRWTGPRLHSGQPPAGAVQMVWANMLLHQVADPQALIRQWHRSLAVDGFLMFSCLGPDTLRELGRNLHVDRFAGLRGRSWQRQWLQAVADRGERDAQGRLKLTFEVIYGHALRPVVRSKMLPESQIGLHDMRQMLARRRPSDL